MRKVENSMGSDMSTRTIPDYTLYKTILETSMDGFWLVDINGNILEVNNAYCELSGYSRKELLSMNVAEVEALESHTKIKKHIKFLNKAGSQRFTTKHRCKNGKIIELEVSANSIKYDHITTFAFFRDITEKIEAQQALRASEELFRNTMDNMLEGCQIIGRDWKYLYVNNTVIKQSRKSKEELLGHTMMDVYPDFEKTHVYSILKDCMEHLKSCQFENEFHFPDGSKGWFILGVQPVPEGIFILSLDITELMEIQKDLQNAKRDWENIFQAIGQPSFILDTERNIIAANRTTVKMTGKPEEELIGKKCHEILHKKDSYPIDCPLEKILSSGSMETGEMEVEALEGTYLVSCTPIFNEQNVLEKIIHIATDITERKKTEKQVMEYQKQLKQMASEILLAEERERHRIAAGIHDDIGQRLAIIKFGLDSLRASESRPEVLSSLKRQGELITNTLEEVRSLTFELSNPLLYEIGVEAAIEAWLMDHIQNKCGIKCNFFSNGPKLYLTEQTRIILFQGVRELLTNIVKHAKADSITVNIIRTNKSMQINIKDNGIGFNASMANKLKNVKRGFGLFNLREKLEYLNGRLEIQDTSPKGTFATIYIPIKKKENNSKEALS
ncbi:MAG: PAS domain S-box protein [Sedimentisphaerales bacterium]|nr:PAS domain S-box protein [Sedimentisphaerales bacterium]